MFDKKAMDKYQNDMFALYDDGTKQHEYNFGIAAGTRLAVKEIIKDLAMMLSVTEHGMLEDNVRQFIRNYKEEYSEIFNEDDNDILEAVARPDCYRI